MISRRVLGNFSWNKRPIVGLSALALSSCLVVIDVFSDVSVHAYSMFKLKAEICLHRLKPLTLHSLTFSLADLTGQTSEMCRLRYSTSFCDKNN